MIAQGRIPVSLCILFGNIIDSIVFTIDLVPFVAE